MDITMNKSTNEIMRDQAVEMRDMIPEFVNGIDTSSMACCPTEVFYFAKEYIKELQEKVEHLSSVIIDAGCYLDYGESGDALKSLYNGLNVDYDYFEKVNEEDENKFNLKLQGDK